MLDELMLITIRYLYIPASVRILDTSFRGNANPNSAVDLLVVRRKHRRGDQKKGKAQASRLSSSAPG